LKYEVAYLETISLDLTNMNTLHFTAPDSSKVKALMAKGSNPGSMKRLLVPVDFSACAYNALNQSLIIASVTGAEVVLLHAIHIPMRTDSLNVGSIDEMEREAKETLRGLESSVEAWTETHGLDHISVKSVLSVGFPSEEIIRVAREMDVTMVVMGTQGAGGVEGFLLGSNAASVINHAGCPVLAMPADRLLYECDKVAFATDLQVIDSAAIEQVIAFARPYLATVEFVHLFTPNEIVASDQLTAFEKKVRAMVSYPNLNFEGYESFHENVADALQQYVDGNKVDVLAMLKRERGFLSGLFHNSVTKKMTISAKEPVLVMHE